MLKCKICGKEFEANLDRHYVARDNGKTGVIIALSNNEEKLYDAFDCHSCGCQVIAQERKRQYIVPNEVAANDEEEEKPVCFGNFDEEGEDDCDECEFNENCVREEYRNKVLKKKNEKRA